MFPRRGSCYLSVSPHQSPSEPFLYSTCHMVVTAEPSWTFFRPMRCARSSESCWVPPCGGNKKQQLKRRPEWKLKVSLARISRSESESERPAACGWFGFSKVSLRGLSETFRNHGSSCFFSPCFFFFQNIFEKTRVSCKWYRVEAKCLLDVVRAIWNDCF